MIRILLAGIVLFSCLQTKADVNYELSRIAADYNANIGIAYGIDGGHVSAINCSTPLPMLSVFKIHVALTALHWMEQSGTSPDSIIVVPWQMMHENTYSPLRDESTAGASVSISLRELINYTVSKSDNNTCDVLIDYCDGTETIEKYIRSLGIDGFRISATENDMHIDTTRCRDNCATPVSVARLLEKVYAGKILSGIYLKCFTDAMQNTSTGTDKIRAGIPKEIVIGHKTGSSDRNRLGVKVADNDAAVIYMPDGRKAYIVVFVCDSRETDKANAAAISRIANCIYKYLISSISAASH